jgi:catechol 2,3-dioxygenase-like lactoylglutathione lyase family enzyme
MLDHVSLGVRDLSRSMRFYDAVLATIGQLRVWTREGAAGYGEPGRDDRLAIFQKDDARPAGEGTHLALTARTAGEVDRFHAEALAHGGTDLGPPGPRPQYGPGYYAAFVLDPDGHKLEAVHHGLTSV